MHTTRQEALWILRAQCGDREAVELLLGSIHAPLRRFLRSLVGPSDADDVSQEVLVLVYRKLNWLSSPGAFRPWVFRIASRAAFRHLKKSRQWREMMSDDGALAALAAPDAGPDAVPSADLLEDLFAMGGISPASRAVLVLHFQEELSLPEVAAVLAIPLGTVKSRLSYGLAALRKQLGTSRSFLV